MGAGEPGRCLCSDAHGESGGKCERLLFLGLVALLLPESGRGCFGGRAVFGVVSEDGVVVETVTVVLGMDGVGDEWEGHVYLFFSSATSKS